MMFSDKGFLDEDNQQLIRKSQKEYEQEYKRIIFLSKIAKELIEKTNSVQLDKQNFIVIALFIKMMNRAESITCLIERGLNSDAKILLRGFIEQLIMLKLCCEDKKYIEIYAKRNLVEHQNWHKYLIGSGIIKEPTLQQLKDINERAKKLSRTFKKEEDKVFQLAQQAGLYDVYVRLYKMFSDEVHSSMNTLDKYIEVNDNYKIIGIGSRNQAETTDILGVLIKFILLALQCYTKLMNWDYEDLASVKQEDIDIAF